MRLFVSIELPEKIKASIDGLIEEMKLKLTPVKWVEDKNLHITLKFLGWVDDKRLKELTALIKRTVKGFGKFDLGFKGMGLFPAEGRPRVIWVDLCKGEDKVKSLGDKIEDEAAKEGFREEEREFTPHLTIGRIKEKVDVEALKKFIKKVSGSDFGSFKVEKISLMKSTLRRTGPIYEELEQINLNPTRLTTAR